MKIAPAQIWVLLNKSNFLVIFIYVSFISLVIFAYQFHSGRDYIQKPTLSSLTDCLASSNIVASQTIFLQLTPNFTNILT